jgi:hypothetical protein
VGTFYLGLVLVVLGTGMLKGNISALVGHLYAPDDVRRDAGYSSTPASTPAACWNRLRLVRAAAVFKERSRAGDGPETQAFRPARLRWACSSVGAVQPGRRHL